MRLGVHAGHWEGRPHDVAALARAAESYGLDSIWVSETWGSDAFVLCAWMAAATERIGIGTGVVQIPARTPAAAAMSALTIDHVSGGRFRLGLGVSGPQVVEGWHGVPYGSPLARTREYVEIVRAVLRREAPLVHEGLFYPLPVPGGQGIPLKANVTPLRPDLPIYLAAMGPRNAALAAEIADGWMPLFFSPEHADAFALTLRTGFDVAPLTQVSIGPDLERARDAVRPQIALYVGAYGSREANYYKELVVRFGFEEEANQIQDAALSGRMSDAIGAVPDALVDAVALVGPAERVRDRLQAYAEAGATTVLAMTKDLATIEALGRIAGSL